MLTVIAAFAMCLAGAVVPIISADIYLAGAAALVAPAWIAPLIVAGTAGQVMGKVIVYAGGASTLQRLRVVDNVVVRAMQRSQGRTTALVFVSALTSLPPFHLVAAACGAMETGILQFTTAATLGRGIRTMIICLSIHSMLRIFP